MAERRVLIVEPFLTGSHRAWAEGWRDTSRHAVDILGSGDGRWRRGMRAGAVTLAADTEAWVDVNGPPDLIRARVKRAVLTISQLRDPGNVPPPKENP